MFACFAIVPLLSSTCKKKISQDHTVTAGKVSNMQKNQKNVQDLELLFEQEEQQWAVYMLRTKKALAKNYHTQKSIKNQAYGVFFLNSAIILSCGLYANICLNIKYSLFRVVLNKKQIFQILLGVCKLKAAHVYSTSMCNAFCRIMNINL